MDTENNMIENSNAIDNTENVNIKLRRDKLTKLLAAGNAFPNDFKRDSYANDLHLKYDNYNKEDLANSNFTVKVAGRIKLKRVMGKAAFLSIQDVSGIIQLYLAKNTLLDSYDEVDGWDIGDIVGATGELFKTKTNELTVNVTNVQLLVKSVRPLPDKHHGLIDTESRYRMRYLDLIMNEHARNTFIARSNITRVIREFFVDHDFLEVETPMMHTIAGGAAAKPFATHHNALDIPLFLRIAPELFLKRLVVGGFERVFELNRNFRNEGVSTQHNPEFTMLEFYMAYHDYHDLIKLTKSLFAKLVQLVSSNGIVEYQGVQLDFNNFATFTIKEAVIHHNQSINDDNYDDVKFLHQYAKEHNIKLEDRLSLGEVQYKLFEETVEHRLIQPTFITQFPVEVSPLARCNNEDPRVTDRFELFIHGKEIANGFSELNDPIDQAARFKAQVNARNRGDDEAMHYDADYITALEYGLPPTAGQGIGIDRLVMLLTNSASIRDVLLFPVMKQK